MTARLDAVAHVFVSDLDALTLGDDDRHHLGRVLRLRAGEVVTASDGAGSWRRCLWRGARGAEGAEAAEGVEPAGDIETEARPTPSITVGFAVPKGERPEWIVQKLTEVGVDRIQPLMTARSVVRWEGDRAAKQVERLRRVAREAAVQSRQVWLPVVEPVRSLAAAWDDCGGDDQAALAQPGGEPPTLARPTVFIGPEGGWAPEEREGRPLVGLGTTVLRAETAAVSGGILLAALRAGIVRASS